MLVLCQSRFRPYSESSLLHQTAIPAPNFDWSEAAARFFLGQRVQSSSSSMTNPLGQAIHDPVEQTSFSSGSQRLIHDLLHPETFPWPQRYLHDPIHPTFLNSEPQTQAFHDLLHSTPFSSGHQRNVHDPFHPTSSSSEPWWWDSGLPLNLAGHQECEELYRLGLTAHPAFRGPMLACHDPHHAGTVTNTDLVTMVLNLLCNSVLKLDQRYCCS